MDDKTKIKLRSVLLEILDEIVSICEKHDLTYYLVGGNLLGAIRHKGFIPWDDDIDIAMPRKDYNKFKELCKTELDSKYFLQNYETDPFYWKDHPKVRKNNTLFLESKAQDISKAHHGIFLDIFILDCVPKEKSLKQDIQGKLYRIIKRLVWYKMLYTLKKTKNIRGKVALLVASFFSLKTLSGFRERIMTLYDNKKCRYYVNLPSPYSYKKHTMPKEIYDPPVKVEFEGKYYNAPNDWDFYLKRIYGDYMKLPPKDKRKGHSPVKVIVN